MEPISPIRAIRPDIVRHNSKQTLQGTALPRELPCPEMIPGELQSWVDAIYVKRNSFRFQEKVIQTE
jgi:hypothetical protein